MANFFWLLVEGLYLHTLLMVMYSENRHFIIYLLIGWGKDRSHHGLEAQLIIRILIQKLRCPDVGGNGQSQYRRLAKSTLLLIPLFGVNYVIFVYLNENEAMENYKIIFDLVTGSFQVQGELKRKWQSLGLTYLSRDYRLHISRNGSENMSQFHRNSRAQSFLQTETTIL
ncbi:hypothetical protein AAFF_G00159770 [Aldrovandia affinis]|uniref:G-protein coupled receptors family 2 profile 2 domain-containing protein n=1 Tax=Aldrovandia affinis TaxID=143900 RepID=A0AAD7W8B6_9TELE|nr:hypothetical protein AAFF_G00159770 [Aldrovandia affinis]